MDLGDTMCEQILENYSVKSLIFDEAALKGSSTTWKNFAYKPKFLYSFKYRVLAYVWLENDINSIWGKKLLKIYHYS